MPQQGVEATPAPNPPPLPPPPLPLLDRTLYLRPPLGPTCRDLLAVSQHSGHGVVQIYPVDLPGGGPGKVGSWQMD